MKNQKIHEYNQLKTSDLIPYINNPRLHSEEQINQIASSIKEFGFTNPILIDEDNGVVAGHGRLMAAQKLNIIFVPCIVLKGLTEAQRKAYVILDNQLPDNASWDLELLKLEIDHLDESGFDLDLLGFDDEFLDLLLDTNSDLPDLTDGEKEPFQTMAFVLHDEQKLLVDHAILKAMSHPLIENNLSDNNRGNALYLICKLWLKSKK